MMNILYRIGIAIGLPAFGILAGLCSIHLFEHMRGNPKGPVYTATTQRGPAIVFGVLILLSITGAYALIYSVLALL